MIANINKFVIKKKTCEHKNKNVIIMLHPIGMCNHSSDYMEIKM